MLVVAKISNAKISNAKISIQMIEDVVGEDNVALYLKFATEILNKSQCKHREENANDESERCNIIDNDNDNDA
jgi:hypothetical protein